MPKIKSIKIKSNPVSTWLLAGSGIITLYFNSGLQDPFNAPKFWILFLLGSWLVGYLITNRALDFIKQNNEFKLLTLILLAFLLSNLFALLFTDNKFVGIFGEGQRKTGFLTYLSFAVLALTACRYISFKESNKFYLYSSFTAVVFLSYGLLQSAGRDFIKWNNPYNSVISTVGNPNFSAAIMAIFACISISAVFFYWNNKFLSIGYGLLFITLVYTIYLTEARQGLLSTVAGSGVFLLFLIRSKLKKLGNFLFVSGFVFLIFAIFGMMQKGPLTSIFYKPTVTIRGYYWRAGVEMFKDNPIVGVGLDRYGYSFKAYRESSYGLKYGYDITSTNAHNVPIQLFATGGFFVGLTYLLLVIYTAYRALKGLKNLKGKNFTFLLGIFSAWIAYQTQSLVSIDNIGIAVWGWLFSGIIIGLSSGRENVKLESNQKTLTVKQLSRPLVSGSATLIALLLVVPMYQGERSTFLQRSSYNNSDSSKKQIFYDYAQKTLKTPLLETNYKILTGVNLLSTGYSQEGIDVLTEILANDPKNLDVLLVLTQLFENSNSIDSAIKTRNNIIYLDPWNTKNYYQLGLLYKSKGDFANMKKMLDKINSFAATDPIAQSANTNLLS
jgi:O-antigen ligase